MTCLQGEVIFCPLFLTWFLSFLMLLVGCFPCPHLLPVKVGFLQSHEKKNFSWLEQENEWHLITWNQTPEFSRHILPLSYHGRRPAVTWVELGLKPLSRGSVLYLYSPIQHQTSLICVPSCSSLCVRSYTWLGVNICKCKDIGTREKHWERIPLSEDYVFPNFKSLHCISSTPLANNLCFRLDWQANILSMSPQVPWLNLPFFPPVICREWSVVPSGV